MARINLFQSHMDGTPDAVKKLLEKVRKNKKGVIGMKIFGEDRHVSDAERKQSLKFALTEATIHCMTLGLESIAQIVTTLSPRSWVSQTSFTVTGKKQLDNPYF